MPTYYSLSSSGSTSITEGGPGQSKLLTLNVHRIWISGPVFATSSVSYRLARYSSANALDFVGATSGTLVFGPDDTDKQITLEIAGDATIEDQEYFSIELFDVVGGYVVPYAFRYESYIENDDGNSTLTVTSNRTGGTLAEATGSTPGSVTFTLKRSSGAGQASIDFAVNYIGATSADFSSPTRGTVTFQPGETSKALTLNIADDALVELEESFEVNWSNPVNLNGSILPTAYYKITDNDTGGGLPQLSITYARQYVPEGHEGLTPVLFTVTRDKTTGASRVDYEAFFDQATNPSDVIGPTSGTLVFNPGEASKTITLQVAADAVTEASFPLTVNLTNAVGAVIQQFKGSASSTVLNDEPSTITFLSTQEEGVESVYPSDVYFRLARSSPVGVSRVRYSIVHDTTTAADFFPTMGDVIFYEGETESKIRIPIKYDTQVEPTERFSVKLLTPDNAVLGGAILAQGSIVDAGSLLPTLSLNNSTLREYRGESLRQPISVSRSSMWSGGLVAGSVGYQIEHLTTSDADFVAGITSGVLQFAAGEVMNSIPVTIADDMLAEGTEKFRIRFFDPVGLRIDTAPYVVSVLDDEEPLLASVGIQALTPAQAEGNQDGHVFNFLLTRSGSRGRADVSWAIVHGSTDVDDFYRLTGTSSFSDGETEELLQIRVAGDLVRETDETFSIILTDAVNAAIGPQSSAQATIVNDDLPEIGITVEPASAARAEGNGADLTTFGFTITRSSSTDASTVMWTLEPGKADASDFFSPWQGTVSFAPGESSRRFVVYVHTDGQVEADETFTVRLSNPTGAVLALNTSAQATIVNDDTPTMGIAAPVTSAILEGAVTGTAVPPGGHGTTPFTFTVSRNSGVGTSSATWKVKPGTAQVSDFSGRLTGTVSLGPGVTSMPVTVLVARDTTIEADETFSVELSAPTFAVIGPASAQATILNDDLPTLSIAAAAGSTAKPEGAAGAITPFTFNVTRNSPIGKTTVDWAALGGASGSVGFGSDDFVGATSGQVTFQPGQTTLPVTVQVRGDSAVEANEVFEVRLGNPVGGILGPTAASVQATITNDDLPALNIAPPVISALAEGQSGTTEYVFTVTRNSALDTASARWTVKPGTAQAADFGSPLTGTVSFVSGQSTQFITVLVKGDTVIEADEVFSVELSAPSKAVIGQAAASATIANDDLPTVSIKTDTASVSKPEGAAGASTPFTFTVTRSSGAGTSSVDWGVRHLAGAGADDFAGPTSGTLTFQPNQTILPVTVLVGGDTLVENDDKFEVVLSNPRNASFGGNVSTVSTGATIRNDDTHTLTISADARSPQPEGATGTSSLVTFTVERSTGPGTSTVQWAVVHGSTTSADFTPGTPLSGTLTFSPDQPTRQTVQVSVAGDDGFEPDEVFSVRLSAPTNATLASSNATATIANDDAPPPPVLGIARDDAVKAEGSPGASTPFTFKVTRSHTLGTSSVDWLAVPFGADAADFAAPTGGTLTFVPGQAEQVITVQVAGDAEIEPDEVFFVQLRNPIDATIETPSAEGTILNDDAPSLSITANAASQDEGTSDGLSEFRFAVTRQPAFNYTEVSYRIVHDGTTADDFAAASLNGTVTFADGQSNKPVSIWVRADAQAEADERFSIELYDPVNGTLLTPTASMMIANDDGVAALTVAAHAVPLFGPT